MQSKEKANPHERVLAHTAFIGLCLDHRGVVSEWNGDRTYRYRAGIYFVKCSDIVSTLTCDRGGYIDNNSHSMRMLQTRQKNSFTTECTVTPQMMSTTLPHPHFHLHSNKCPTVINLFVPFGFGDPFLYLLLLSVQEQTKVGSSLEVQYSLGSWLLKDNSQKKKK